MSNECPAHYFCGLDNYGARNDRAARPELSAGSVEFVAPPSYLLRPPQPPVILFVIDTTQTAVASGALRCSLRAVRAALEAMARRLQDSQGAQGLTRAGIMSYDAALTFYDARPPSGSSSVEGVSVAVTGDVDDAFCALAPAQLAPPLAEAYPRLLAVLDHIEATVLAGAGGGGARSLVGAVGAAVKAAIDGAAHSGGRVVLFQVRRR